jgi:hypothetical protein
VHNVWGVKADDVIVAGVSIVIAETLLRTLAGAHTPLLVTSTV